MKVTLTVLEHRPRTVAVDSPNFVIGRAADCDLRLTSPLVSRHHCMLSKEDDRVYVRDLQSSNGTGLNNRAIEGQRPLHNGDKLWVAATPIRIVIREDRRMTAIVDEVFRTLWPSRKVSADRETSRRRSPHVGKFGAREVTHK